MKAKAVIKATIIFKIKRIKIKCINIIIFITKIFYFVK